MTLPRVEVRDPPVLTAGVIRSPRSARSSSLEPRNYELDIRLKPVGFLLVEIHRRFIKVGRLHGRFELGEPMLLKRVVDLANFTRQLWNVPLCTRCRCTRCRTATQGH